MLGVNVLTKFQNLLKIGRKKHPQCFKFTKKKKKKKKKKIYNKKKKKKKKKKNKKK